MKKIISSMIVLCSIWLAATPAVAQQTTGSISGRILDDQGAAVPGATVTGKNLATGFVRTDVSDGEGIFRLTALPVGTYDLTTELQGFSKVESKGVVVNVGQTLDLNLTLKLATVSETITVNAESPLIQTSSSSVGGVVDVNRIENLPLNGRQFANAAITIAGVGLGFHSDPTKSTQYSPQIAGGNGRNVNYLIDGGDNNDDTVGGLLQLFPLEAIQEFNFVTQRYKAEYGRSNGGVMNIVTKSGTNDFRGSWFTSMRDTSLNAKTQTEKINKLRRRASTSGISTAARSADRSSQNKAHFFAAYERTQQDTTQSVNTLGLFPELDGVFADAEPREPLHGQGVGQSDAVAVPVGPLRPQHQLAGVRRDDAPRSRQLGRQHEQLQLDQLQPQLGARRIEAERDRVPVRGLRATRSRRARVRRRKSSRTA